MPPQQSAGAAHRRSLDTTSVWVLIGTIIASIFIVVPSASFSLPATKAFLLAAGTLATLAIYLLARLTRGNIILPSSALLGALWLPTFAYLLSAVFSGVPFSQALWGTSLESDTLGFMLVAACLGTLAALVLRRPEQYRTFFTAAAYTFGLLAGLSTLGVLVGHFMPSALAPGFSFLGSFTDLAAVLGLGVIVILITLRFIEVSLYARRALTASVLLALFLLAIANVALVWELIVLVSLGLFVESILRKAPSSSDADMAEVTLLDDEVVSKSDEGNHSLVMPLVVLAVALFFLLGGTLGNALANALQVNTIDVRPSLPSTLAVAQRTYTTAPLFGSGPNTFGVEWLKHRDASLNSTVFWNVDFTSGIGFIPTSFVTTGGIGVAAWLVFLALFLVLGLRMLILRTPQDGTVRAVAVMSFVATVYLFAIALLDVPGSVILTLAFVFAGIFVSSMRYAADGRQWGVVFSRAPRLGFVIVFTLTLTLLSSVVATYSLVERSVAVAALTKSIAALSAGQLDAADRSVQSALSFAPMTAAYQVEAGIANARINAIVSSSTMSKTAAQQAYQATLSAGVTAAITATNANPSEYQSWLVLGRLYAQAVPLGVSGAYDSAKSAYAKAQALNPTNPQIPYIIATLDIANKDVKAAEADLKQAITLKQDYTDAIFLLSQLEVQDGNVKDALAAALAAAYFTPNDSNILFQVGVLYAAQNDLSNAALALAAAVAANPQFANAHYFLAAVEAKRGNLQEALNQMQTIGALSNANATAVAPLVAALQAGKNPFPANLLSASSTPIKQ